MVKPYPRRPHENYLYLPYKTLKIGDFLKMLQVNLRCHMATNIANFSCALAWQSHDRVAMPGRGSYNIGPPPRRRPAPSIRIVVP